MLCHKFTPPLCSLIACLTDFFKDYAHRWRPCKSVLQSFISLHYFFSFTNPPPPSQSVCFHPLACLYVNLTKFTHFPWKSSRIWSDMNCIKKGIQIDSDSNGLYAATGIEINSFWCSLCLQSLAAGIAKIGIKSGIKSATGKRLNPPSQDV